jgi:hypothetical protein
MIIAFRISFSRFQPVELLPLEVGGGRRHEGEVAPPLELNPQPITPNWGC